MALGSQVCSAPRVGTAGHCIVSRIGCPSGGDKLKVFISYARRDTAAADALVAALQSREFEVLIDRRSLPFGDEWQAEL